jgi:zinc protease
MWINKNFTGLAIAMAILAACASQTEIEPERIDADAAEKLDAIVGFEKYQLDNGLTVIFHVDRSDPVVAVALTTHVGSAREVPGRTGFAHLFEHLLFLESENLGKGGLDQMSARIGGSGANGSTGRDRTNYFQTVPNDALEKMIWAEADKLGYFIKTVTEAVLAKEKQVVKNEKRQGVDNQPYGHVAYVVDKNLYPEGHPYSWQVIGSLEDLQNATLQDVKDFYNRWYVPNNVTLAIAGDFDAAQARDWVQKYFGDIPRGADTPVMGKWPSDLIETRRVYYEDNFARLPELRLTWPAVYQFHPDSWALDVLAQYLSEGKTAPLHQVVVDEQTLASDVFMGSRTSELAGSMILGARAFPGTNLNELKSAFDLAFRRFEAEGISERDLNRIKISQEVSFFNGIGSVIGKAFQLAQYQIFADDPGFIDQDIKNIGAVTIEDVMRVYNLYIKDRPYVATSFVPLGLAADALEGSTLAQVDEEQIVAGAEAEVDASGEATFERSPSKFDRTVEPPYGEPPIVKVPDIWEAHLANGLGVYGIENRELPLVQFDLSINGGQLLDSQDRTGVANLLAVLLNRGTENRTPAELEVAIQELGASIAINVDSETINASGSTIARNYTATMALLTEMLLQPRWDETEFELAKLSAASELSAELSNPNAIARNEYRRLIFGGDHILALNILGTPETIDSIQLDDLREYYDKHISPGQASLHLVGAISQEEALAALDALATDWAVKLVTIPVYDMPDMPAAAQIYFFDVPGAKQSVLLFGYPAMAETDPDFYPAQVMNYILGGGSFASRLTQQLREGKGYTYNISSSFSGSKLRGPFTVSSGVRSNITTEASRLIFDILDQYGDTYTENDLGVTQNYLLKSKARSFETLAAKTRLLQNISTYDWPYDYIKEQDAIIGAMTVERIQDLAAKYIQPERMIYLVVGDAETQFERLKELGLGSPIKLN